jgi:hypothetical protein
MIGGITSKFWLTNSDFSGQEILKSRSGKFSNN